MNQFFFIFYKIISLFYYLNKNKKFKYKLYTNLSYFYVNL